MDEADLMKLMDEKELEQFAPTEEVEPEPTPEPEPEPEVPEEEPEPESKVNFLPAVLLMLALAGGSGFFLYKKFQKKKAQQEQEKPILMPITPTMRTTATRRKMIWRKIRMILTRRMMRP